MIRANIINGDLIFVPFDETLPFIEMTEQQFNDIVDGKLRFINGLLVDMTETIKQQKYEKLIVSKIREKYSLDQELAILRQRDTKPQEFAEYNAYVEQCKLEAKTEVSNGN